MDVTAKPNMKRSKANAGRQISHAISQMYGLKYADYTEVEWYHGYRR